MVFSVPKDDEVNLVFHYSCTIINVSQKELQHTVTQELQYEIIMQMLEGLKSFEKRPNLD